MSDGEWLGTLEQLPDGRVVVKRPELPPEPEEPDEERRRLLPRGFERRIREGRLSFGRVIGRSMEPTLLDNDLIIEDPRRKPKNGDIVTVENKTAEPPNHPLIVGRYKKDAAGVELIYKDNPRADPFPLKRAGYRLTGVVIRTMHRDRRRRNENHRRVETDRAMLRSCGHAATAEQVDGFYKAGAERALRPLLEIPDSELIEGRLPWGLFRARFFARQERFEIAAGDWATVDLNRNVKIGDFLVLEGKRGEPFLGILQRDMAKVTADPFSGWYYCDSFGRRLKSPRKDARTIGQVLRVTKSLISIGDAQKKPAT